MSLLSILLFLNIFWAHLLIKIFFNGAMAGFNTDKICGLNRALGKQFDAIKQE